jgi:hypothetical protein
MSSCCCIDKPGERVTLIFDKQPLTQHIARSLRSGTRVTRPSFDGHRFDYNDLKELWASGNGQHVVLTHDKDPIWQYWRLIDKSWRLMNVATTRRAAQVLAQSEEMLTAPAGGAGTYVVAKKDDRAIRVKCQSENGSTELTGIFTRLGYEVQVDEVL